MNTEGIDLENIPSVDDSADLSKLDRGDSVVATPVDEKAAAPETEKAAAPETEKAAAPETEKAAAPETEKAAAPDDEKAADKPKAGIPKARFDEVIAKSNARAERDALRIAELQAQITQATQVSGMSVTDAQSRIDELIDQHTQLTQDGKTAEAKTAMREMQALQQQMTMTEAARIAAQERVQAVEVTRYHMAIDKLEEDYPFLAEAHADFDPDFVAGILFQAEALAAKGIPQSQAITRAATDAVELRDYRRSRTDAPATTALKDGAPKARTTQVQKNITAAIAQAPSVNAMGVDTDRAGEKNEKIDIQKLSPDEYDALPASTKARLRGDAVMGA